MLMREVETTTLCPCGSTATVRCLECANGIFSCRDCLVKSHRHLPFHWIQEWQETHFVKKDLSEIGYILYMGHHGSRCSHIPTNLPKSTSELIIGHHNGIHKVNVAWCHCPGRGDHIQQSMLGGLFPCSLVHIKSAFTFTLLKEFHIHHPESKKSAYDFVHALVHLSNGTFADEVPVSHFGHII